MKKETVINAFLILVLVAGGILAADQAASRDAFEEAFEAWDTGDYVPALQAFEALLRGPEADVYFEKIALLTGELFEVTEIARDGRNVRFSPSGGYAAFDSGSGSESTIHILEVADGLRKVVEIQGYEGTFSPDGNLIAFLRPGDSEEIRKTREDMDALNAQAEVDRRAVFALQRQLAYFEAKYCDVVLYDFRSGKERVLPTGGLLKGDLAFSADGREVYFVGVDESNPASNEIYAVPWEGKKENNPRPVTAGPGFKISPVVLPGGTFLVYRVSAQSPFPAPPGAGQPGRTGQENQGEQARAAGRVRQEGQGIQVRTGQAVAAGQQAPGRQLSVPQSRRPSPIRRFSVVNLKDGSVRTFDGTLGSGSRDGASLVFVGREGAGSTLTILTLADGEEPSVIKSSPETIYSATLSPDGTRIAFDMTYTRNAEVFLIDADGKNEVRLTREIQHDRSPRFLSDNRVLAIKGESRHSRSYLYDTETGAAVKLFHNNTVRTIAPEYEWAADPEGRRILIVSDRDGDTMSPERGVYILDLGRKIAKEKLLARIERQSSVEEALRSKGEALFKPISGEVEAATSRVSMTRIFEYQKSLFDFDSKHVAQPGNRKAGEYLFRTLESFGYRPEYQWVPDRPNETANVIAVLEGVENPDLFYVVSSHYDSNARGPGADDNSSATAVLLETARLLADKPLSSSVIFAAFTGEESGFWGSREFVRRAKEDGLHVLGAINNDMIGWTNDHRLDDTIRYSNAGIRDVLHASAFGFSRMVTYDTRYIRSTDSVPLYEAWGDVVGGLGSYPVLGNPYYHQPTDLLETVNQHLVTEAARYNTAAVMLLASSPSPVRGLKVQKTGPKSAMAEWSPNPEKGTAGYLVVYGPESRPAAFERKVEGTRARLDGIDLVPGEKLVVTVRAVNKKGLVSWDEARVEAPLNTETEASDGG